MILRVENSDAWASALIYIDTELHPCRILRLSTCKRQHLSCSQKLDGPTYPTCLPLMTILSGHQVLPAFSFPGYFFHFYIVIGRVVSETWLHVEIIDAGLRRFWASVNPKRL
jgi:hypothetical protein